MATAALTPCSPGLKLALSQARPTTPTKPSTRPSTRPRLSGSPSQTQAISAAHIEVVALKLADRPVSIANAATAKSMKGRAEWITPTKAMVRQCWRSGARCRAINSSGSRHRAAPPTRTAVIGTAPNSGTDTRMNRKDMPHSAASASSSMKSRGFM